MNIAVAGVMSVWTFQTSIFDPDLTGTGHQPLWRDELNQLYSRYRVHGIKYRFNILNVTVQNMVVGAIVHAPQANSETNVQTMRERRGVKKFVVQPLHAGNTVITGYMPTGQPHGMSRKDFLADETFEADMTTSPATKSFLELYATSIEGTGKLQAQVDLVYYVELLQRRRVQSS